MAAPTPLTFLFILGSSLLLLLLLLLLSLYIMRRRRRSEEQVEEPSHHSVKAPLHQDLPEWLPPPPLQGGDELAVAGGCEEGEQQKGEDKRRKRRGRKKRPESCAATDGREEGGGCNERERVDGEGTAAPAKVGFPYPFSSFASAMQRKIKMQYDQLVKSNQSKALTITQVGQFVNCLVDARKELQHKSEIIQRSYKIKKALLCKADRSSFDRLCQQIYKLEAEQQRIEEDTAVYNLLQEQLKLSPAYKTMLEIGANMKLNATHDKAMEFSDISFEELLAQEKKDSFWQSYGKQRSFAG